MDERTALYFIAFLFMAENCYGWDGSCNCSPHDNFSEGWPSGLVGPDAMPVDGICITSARLPGVPHYSNFSSDLDPRLTLRRDGFRDSDGRKVFLRGINVASNAKLPPFIPFHDPMWWDLLASWGYNAVRLTIFWEAVEPSQGEFDQGYLRHVEEMVDEASKRGIYLLLDMHQDQYSRYLKGDGAPAWALPKSVDPGFNSGIAGRFWFTAYFFSGDVRRSFSNFFMSDHLKDHYCSSWKEVVKRVSDNPFILGYDIMNEPFGGSISNDHGQFENVFLKPFYLKAVTSIRQVDPYAVCFVEPCIIDLFESKLEPLNVSGLVYAPHLYRSFSMRAWLDPEYNGSSFQALLDLQRAKADELSMPLFIGEFGVPFTSRPVGSRDHEVNDAMNALEKSFVDNAYWDFSVENGSIWNDEDYSLIDNQGRPRGIEVNVRPYLRRLDGTPIYQSFDPENGDYRLAFDGMPEQVPSVIFIPKSLHYPNGLKVCISDGSVRYRRESGELWYSPERNGRHCLSITALVES
jgi:endoglycosylceramidase